MRRRRPEKPLGPRSPPLLRCVPWEYSSPSFALTDLYQRRDFLKICTNPGFSFVREVDDRMRIVRVTGARKATLAGIGCTSLPRNRKVFSAGGSLIHISSWFGGWA